MLAGSDREGIEHAWLGMLTALPHLFEGEPDAVVPSFAEAESIADRLRDADTATFARFGLGHSLIPQGRRREGMALLDEVMVAVTADEVSPVIAGIAYCQVISLCQAVYDLRRARDPVDRSRLLPAYAEVSLAADDRDAARAAAEELVAIAAHLDAPYLHAVASHARGAVLLADGNRTPLGRRCDRRSMGGAILPISRRSSARRSVRCSTGSSGSVREATDARP
jgi:hypothetical protein